MKQKADVLIVGTGAAGLFCALQLSEHLEICMISKQDLENSDSYLAQGGISTLKNEQDYASYYMDTMKAGHYENDPLAVEMMIRSSPEIISRACAIRVKGRIPRFVFCIMKMKQDVRLRQNC